MVRTEIRKRFTGPPRPWESQIGEYVTFQKRER
jgi:hypothetical protein